MAIPILEGVTEQSPGLPAGWMNLAGCYAETKRFEEAVEAYKMLTTLMPDEAHGFTLLGHTYTQMGKYEEAISTLKHAEQMPSATFSEQLGLAEAYEGAGRLEEAEQALKRAWQMDSTATAVCNMYADFLRKHKRFAELIELMSTAIQQAPKQAGPYGWRAVAHSRQSVRLRRKRSPTTGMATSFVISRERFRSLSSLNWPSPTASVARHTTSLARRLA